MHALGPMISCSFTVHHISGGFVQTGLWPINRSIVINNLLKKQSKHSQSLFPDLLPEFSTTRDERDIQTMSRLIDYYAPSSSSPTRAGLSDAAAMISESLSLHERLEQEARGRLKHLGAQHAKLSQSKSKPDGEVHNGQSINEMRQELILEDEADHEKAVRRIQRIKKAEDNKIKKNESQHKTARRKTYKNS